MKKYFQWGKKNKGVFYFNVYLIFIYLIFILLITSLNLVNFPENTS